MQNRPNIRRGLLPVLIVTVLAAAVYHIDVVGRVAYAFERGRLKADSDHIAAIDAVEIAALEQVSHAFAVVAETVKPSVVNIHSLSTNKFHAEIERMFEGRPFQIPPRRGTGSGVILDTQGHIVTNNHVVEDAETVNVTLADGRVYRAEIVGTDSMTDVAVLKINTDRLHPVRFGDSDNVKVGNLVLAIGSPFRLEHSVSHGIISALGRTDVKVDVDYQNWIQTDAPINPGNSGGPLINTRGEVIGINVAIATESGGHQGVGFAIPSNTVARIAELLKNGEMIRRGYLGVVIQQVTPKMADAYGLAEPGGVFIGRVGPDSPAAAGGLMPEDIIKAIDGRKIQTREQLQELIAATAPETPIEVSLWRDGSMLSLSITVGEQPEAFSTSGSIRDLIQQPDPDADETGEVEEPETANEEADDAKVESDSETETEFQGLGFTADTLTPQRARQFRLDSRGRNGAIITAVRPTSEAYVSGLRPGDVIGRANGRAILNVADLQQILTGQAIAKGVRLKVFRGDEPFYTVLQVH